MDGKEFLAYHCTGSSLLSWCDYIDINEQENIDIAECSSSGEDSFFTPSQSPVVSKPKRTPLSNSSLSNSLQLSAYGETVIPPVVQKLNDKSHDFADKSRDRANNDEDFAIKSANTTLSNPSLKEDFDEKGIDTSQQSVVNETVGYESDRERNSNDEGSPCLLRDSYGNGNSLKEKVRDEVVDLSLEERSDHSEEEGSNQSEEEGSDQSEEEGNETEAEVVSTQDDDDSQTEGKNFYINDEASEGGRGSDRDTSIQEDESVVKQEVSELDMTSSEKGRESDVEEDDNQSEKELSHEDSSTDDNTTSNREQVTSETKDRGSVSSGEDVLHEEDDKDEEVKTKGAAKSQAKLPGTFQVGFQFRKLVKHLYEQQTLLDRFGPNLPDHGESIKRNIKMIKERMIHLKGYIPSAAEIQEMLSEPFNDTESESTSSNIKKNLQVHAQSKELTHGVVHSLHQCISSRPSDETLEDTPPQLKVKLMDHQRHGLAYFKWREAQIPSGGILADEMGLGKTLSMISLIVSKRSPTTFSRDHKEGLLTTSGTLIVAPLTLISMWKEEIESKLYPSTLSVLVFHGPNRPKDPRKYSVLGVNPCCYRY